ncbi:hypothetical protein M426DRAFT_318481 [Hypoxylon sp. CI-4A]|nr:hypothetical protein M426DRAFT_318481 [Hypoxylon sp. CI-4A]
MTRPTVPPNLPALVKAAFNKARANGDVTYYQTQVAIVTPSSIAFQLRFSPSLALKPKAPPKPKEPNGKPFNPFEDPSPAMLVAEQQQQQQPATHRLVLNKFAVVPEHFILATRAVKPQTHVLEQADVAATSACVDAYRAHGGQELFAFFNCGPHSGASQPHRHLQLLPVARMRDGLDGVARGGEWGVLAERVAEAPQVLPFAVFTADLRAGMSDAERYAAYLELYRRAVRAVHPDAYADAEVPGEGEAKISYNFAMTSNSMALCPRRAEGAMLKSKSGEDIGVVSLNGTVLAGTALVKNEAEWNALREDPDLLLSVLKGIGFPP